MTPLGAATAQLATRAGVVAALVAIDGTADGARRAATAAAATAALLDAGHDAGWVVDHAEDGRPLWPAGFTGSVSHTDEDAIVAVGATAMFAAIGVDLEHSAALEVVDAQLVLDEHERAVVDMHRDGNWAATLLWSAKESAFKAWSTATEGRLGRVDPVDIHVALDEPSTTFTVEAGGALGAAVREWGVVRGCYAEAGGNVVTLAVIPARASG